MSRVILFQGMEDLNISKAHDFGEVTALFELGERRASVYDENLGQEVLERLQALEFDPKLDLVLLSGQQTALIRLTTTIVSKYGAFRGLTWVNKHRKYIIRGYG